MDATTLSEFRDLILSHMTDLQKREAQSLGFPTCLPAREDLDEDK